MRIRRLAFLAIFALASLPISASALTLAVQQAIGVSASSPPADYSIDFRKGSATGWSNTRASTAMAANKAGVWTDFATTTVRVTNRGALAEATRNNIIKFNNDLTNVLWVKSNATAALDQTGIDGAVNGASSLLATAANATVCQTVVSASASRQPSAFVKRLVGTGPVDMTIDNGSTWVAITPCASTVGLGMPECRVNIPPQTVTNPTLCFRPQTSGDKIAVAVAQSESSTVPTSPMFVGAINVTRASDLITLDAVPVATTSMTVAVSVVQDFPIPGIALSVDDGTINNRLTFQPLSSSGGPLASYNTGGVSGPFTNSATKNATQGGVSTTIIASFTPGFVMFSVNGGPVSTGVSSIAFPTGLTQVHLGSLSSGVSSLFGYVEAMELWKDVALNQPQLRSWRPPTR